jgi:GxxExxY protein
MMKYSEVTEKIIGSAMKVHREMGFGFQEYIYQRALEIEFKKNSLSFIREYEMPIYYAGEKIGIRIVDFLVEGKIMVELKAMTELNDAHFAQTFNYLEASGIEIGLLINFGTKSLQFKRLHNRKLNSQ